MHVVNQLNQLRLMPNIEVEFSAENFEDSFLFWRLPCLSFSCSMRFFCIWTACRSRWSSISCSSSPISSSMMALSWTNCTHFWISASSELRSSSVFSYSCLRLSTLHCLWTSRYSSSSFALFLWRPISDPLFSRSSRFWTSASHSPNFFYKTVKFLQFTGKLGFFSLILLHRKTKIRFYYFRAIINWKPSIRNHSVFSNLPSSCSSKIWASLSVSCCRIIINF